jgi:hypothetical protein
MRTIKMMIEAKAPREEIIKAVDDILFDVISSIPIPTYKIKGMLCLGPFVYKGLEAISKEQRKLSKKLDLELRKMLRTKYPMYL